MKNIIRRLSALVCVLALCLTSANALSVDDARKLLQANYVDQLPAAALEATTLDELFDALGDPYTYYMTAEEYEEFKRDLESETSVTGIGAAIEYTDDGILITDVLKGGGAEEAGLVAGDLIIAVDGESCVPGAESHRSRIIGEEGTYVTITVRRADGSVQDFRIERKTVTVLNTSVERDGDVATLKCNSFGSHTADYFTGDISENADARLWIVDVRSNPGGLASAAVAGVGMFTGSGEKLFYRLGSNYTISSRYSLSALTDAPVIMLVNGYSASASEILSGGIRAEKAGIIVGSRTYGKGTAQIIVDDEDAPELFDGDAIKITAYRFYVSDGNTNDKIGVIPTLLVSGEHTEDVAALLSIAKPTRGEYLVLTLNGRDFYLSPSAARDNGKAAVLTDLLSALPPDASISLVSGGRPTKITSAEALKRYGNASASRLFTDVADSPYATAINTLATYEILRGVENGVFAPERTLTRAELCAMLAQALNVTGSANSTFSDVPAGAWYADEVDAIAGLGFVTGTGDNCFAPDAPLTQEQFITIMGRLTRFLNFHADDYALSLMNEQLSAKEFDAYASWSRESLNVLTNYEGGSILCAPLDEIAPDAVVTREQAAATLYNILDALDIISY